MPKQLSITSTDALDAAVADVVRLKIRLSEKMAAKDAEIAMIEKYHQKSIQEIQDQIADLEASVHDYCTANRAELFSTKKSRETSLAIYGFEYTPFRVEPRTKKIKFKDIVKNLLRTKWGQVYVRIPEPKLDKEALLADRQKLKEDQLTAVGIMFVQDEQFFIRPKLESAD
jgi:phage host-nuclease inhibitor protein Gam